MEFPVVALIGRHQDSGLAQPLRTLAKKLGDMGCQIMIEAHTARYTGVQEYPAATFEEIGQQARLAIVMGGDGTVLGAARHLARFGVPLVGINHGRLGFITDIALGEAQEALAYILAGEYVVEERTLLQADVWRSEKNLVSALALNDVVLNRAGRGGMIEVQVDLDDVPMLTQRADGLIIATPTGSTAYALSAGGPLLYPSLHTIVLVPIAPQTLSNRPIVIADNGVLSMTLTAIGRSEAAASVHFDMQSWSDLQPGDRVTVQRAPYTIQFLHPKGYSFFATLRRKLHWNLMPQGTDLTS